MISIIPATSFKTVPWKNGKGETIELAINDGGTLKSFDWRLSIASVTENGVFSDFSGYQRNLVLIDGNSIHLTHDNTHTDKLTQHLDFATFDGGSVTEGLLPAGSIKDFNIITSHKKFQTKVETFPSLTEQEITFQGLVFAYSLSDVIHLTGNNSVNSSVIKQGDLVQLKQPKNITLKGKDIILVFIKMM